MTAPFAWPRFRRARMHPGALLASLLLLLPAAPLRAESLKLATWNIAWLTLRPTGDPALPRDISARTAADFAALSEYARRLEADVLALQEIDGPGALARILDPTGYRVFFADEPDIQRVAIAVRRGIPAEHHPDLAALDLRPRALRSLRRGVDVTVGQGAARLRLLALHLIAGCRETRDEGAQCDDLAQQTTLVAAWVAARRAEGVPFALLGDFNRRLSDADPMQRALAGHGPLLRTTAGASDPCWLPPDARGGRPFIDHILLGGGAERWLIPGSLRVMVYAERGPEWRERLSDHCPVSVRLRLP